MLSAFPDCFFLFVEFFSCLRNLLGIEFLASLGGGLYQRGTNIKSFQMRHTGIIIPLQITGYETKLITQILTFDRKTLIANVCLHYFVLKVEDRSSRRAFTKYLFFFSQSNFFKIILEDINKLSRRNKTFRTHTQFFQEKEKIKNIFFLIPYKNTIKIFQEKEIKSKEQYDFPGSLLLKRTENEYLVLSCVSKWVVSFLYITFLKELFVKSKSKRESAFQLILPIM